MKILHITPGIFEGGVATLIFEMCNYQYKQGHNISVLCLRNDLNQLSRKKKFKESGAKVIFGKYENIYDFRNILIIKKMIKEFDIVHVHLFPNQLYSKIAYKLINKKSRPILITTEHSTYNNRRKYKFMRIFDRWIYSSYHAIVCISEQTEIALKCWLKSKKINSLITTITNGVNLDFYANSNVNNRDESNVVIMVSRLSAPKDPITLVRAIAKCSQNVSLVFVGSGELAESIEQEAQKLHIDSKVKLLGNRTDVPYLLSKAKIGVLSTNWDGFGLVIVEYMASGLPVLASDVDGLKEVVGDSESLFKCGDSESLSKKIDRLIKDENYYKSKSNFFKERSKNFSIVKMNAEYLELYFKLKYLCRYRRLMRPIQN